MRGRRIRVISNGRFIADDMTSVRADSTTRFERAPNRAPSRRIDGSVVAPEVCCEANIATYVVNVPEAA